MSLSEATGASGLSDVVYPLRKSSDIMVWFFKKLLAPSSQSAVQSRQPVSCWTLNTNITNVLAGVSRWCALHRSICSGSALLKALVCYFRRDSFPFVLVPSYWLDPPCFVTWYWLWTRMLNMVTQKHPPPTCELRPFSQFEPIPLLQNGLNVYHFLGSLLKISRRTI